MMKKNGNWLNPENCNKAKCKTCIFGDTPLELPVERMNEIKSYLAKGESSHICHTTDKTCYGALEFQAKIFYMFKYIKENTVKCLLETANKILNKK